MEKTNVAPQKSESPFARIKSQILAQQDFFTQRGYVEKFWRKTGGHQVGPYYRVAFRQGKVRKSIYLGRSAELAQQVETLLAELQSCSRERRDIELLRKQIRASLRKEKKKLEEMLRPLGYYMKGYSFHRCQPN